MTSAYQFIFTAIEEQRDDARRWSAVWKAKAKQLRLGAQIDADLFEANVEAAEAKSARLRAVNAQLVEACDELLNYAEILIGERVELGLPEDHPGFVPPPIANAQAALVAARDAV